MSVRNNEFSHHVVYPRRINMTHSQTQGFSPHAAVAANIGAHNESKFSDVRGAIASGGAATAR